MPIPFLSESIFFQCSFFIFFIQNNTLEELSLLTVQLVSKFLFHTGFHTKKALRGPASEWNEVLTYHLKNYRSVRKWFAVNILLNHPNRLFGDTTELIISSNKCIRKIPLPTTLIAGFVNIYSLVQVLKFGQLS